MRDKKMLNQVKNILCVGMPVADILISGARANNLMERFNMLAGVRNMLDDAQIIALEAEIISGDYEVQIVAGGSMANSACSVANLCDANIDFFAAISDDNYGAIFTTGLKEAGIKHLPSGFYGVQTSRSYVITDNSGERAIARHLGDSMSKIDVDHFKNAIDDCDLMLLEGELPSLPNGHSLWLELLQYAKSQDKMIGFSLFGAEQVAKHRKLFMQTIEQYADLVFGNEGEIAALFAEKLGNFEQECQDIFAIMQGRNQNAIMCISHGDKAPYLASGNGVFRTPPSHVDNLVNTLGAGDGFMAGTLAGLLKGLTEENALKLGHKVASAVLQQAAPQLSKADLLAIKPYAK
jgi:sugar/nucleoside kinase (ribokinase family)